MQRARASSGCRKSHRVRRRSSGSGLTAADRRLGKAHDVGRALAETCFAPEDQGRLIVPSASHRRYQGRTRGPRLVFPRPRQPRRSALVAFLGEASAADPRLDDETLNWPRHAAAVRQRSVGQGEVWRALLTGEKEGKDMLDAWPAAAADSLVAEIVSSCRALSGRFPFLSPSYSSCLSAGSLSSCWEGSSVRSWAPSRR